MDRPTIYYGQVPRAADLLTLGQSAMIGLGALAQSTLGSGTVIDGFTLTPTAPASLSAVLGAGSVYQLEEVEPSPWSSFPVDTRPLVKQGLSLDAITLPFAPPTTPGYAQNFLVEVQYQDADAGALVLPYYNAANPQQPFAGPANSGTAQSTIRRGVAAIQVKAGVAATAGSQVTPSPDAGWAGAHVVTLNAGQTQITAGSIARYSLAPFIDAKLPQIPYAVQSGRWTYAVAGGSANALTASLAPTPSAIPDGFGLSLAITQTNTGPATFNPNGLAVSQVLGYGGGQLAAGDLTVGDIVPLIMRNGAWRMRLLARSEVPAAIGAPALWHAGTAGGTASALVVDAVSPPITADQDFTPCLIRVPNGIAANATLTIGGVSGPLQRNDGSPIQSGDGPPNSDVLVNRHGNAWRLVGFGRAELSGGTSSSDVLNIIAANPSLSPPRNLVSFTTAGNGTWTVPDRVTWIYVELVGGGGGGHGGAGGVTWSGGGGGSGGYSARWINVTPGQTISYAVGAGGAGSDNSSDTFAATGGTTAFGPIQATGGGGGRGGPGGCNGGVPGVGSGGQKNFFGANGGDGNPVNNAVQGGNGASSAFGGGGRTATINNPVMNGVAPGSGGGGAWYTTPSAQAGGNGADGGIIIQY
ncbi:glycine-rich domain-containing protein [Methylobacterium sp. Gmos1]